MLTTLVADDHTLFRAAIVKLLQGFPNVEVIGEAASGRQAVELAALLGPDLVTMDLGMPGMNELDATAKIHAQNPTIKIIVVTMHTNQEYAQAALNAGASAFVPNRSTPEVLRLAIETAAHGGVFLGTKAAGKTIRSSTDQDQDSSLGEPHLTTRQQQVLQLLAEGKGTQEIASVLKLSVKTVETHRLCLMHRLHLRNAAALVHYAARLWLFSDFEPLAAADLAASTGS